MQERNVIISFFFFVFSEIVIITGSQIPICMPRNDAVDNLLGALTIAAHFQIPEVTLLAHLVIVFLIKR